MTEPIQSKIHAFFSTPEPLNEQEVQTSIARDPSVRNPFVEKFGKNVKRDCLVLQELNRQMGSEDLRTRATAINTLVDLGKKIVSCEKGYLEAAQEYNNRFTTYDSKGLPNCKTFVNMTPFELHFFTRIFTNPEIRHDIRTIHNFFKEQGPNPYTEAALQPDFSHLSTVMEKYSKDLMKSFEPTKELSGKFSTNTINFVKDANSEISKRTSENLSERPSVDKSTTTKPKSFLSRLLSLFSSKKESVSSKSANLVAQNSLQEQPRSGWEKFKSFFTLFFAVSTDDKDSTTFSAKDMANKLKENPINENLEVLK